MEITNKQIVGFAIRFILNIALLSYFKGLGVGIWETTFIIIMINVVLYIATDIELK